jgi:hypothetical protein
MVRALVAATVVGAVALVGANYEAHPLPADVSADRVVIEKSARKLTLFRGDGLLKSYSVALGRSPKGTKEREGDHGTPEGNYVIVSLGLKSHLFEPSLSTNIRRKDIT